MKRILRILAIVASVALIVPGLAWTGELEQSPTVKQTRSSATEPARKAYIDPETGELRAPTREELRQSVPSQHSKLPREPAKVIIREDGVRLIELGPAYWSALQVQVNESGEIETGHGLNPEPDAAADTE